MYNDPYPTNCSECFTSKSVHAVEDDYKSYAVKTKCKECKYEGVRYRGYLKSDPYKNKEILSK